MGIRDTGTITEVTEQEVPETVEGNRAEQEEQEEKSGRKGHQGTRRAGQTPLTTESASAFVSGFDKKFQTCT